MKTRPVPAEPWRRSRETAVFQICQLGLVNVSVLVVLMFSVDIYFHRTLLAGARE